MAVTNKFSEYKHWLGCGIALRTAGGRFRCWCFVITFGPVREWHFPVWPYRYKQKKETHLWQ
jgi:hypothetical protein